jgi:hypothetical protein
MSPYYGWRRGSAIDYSPKKTTFSYESSNGNSSEVLVE